MPPDSLYADSNALPWREGRVAGVQWKKLHFDEQSGASAVLLRFAPGTAYPAHRHPGGEEYYVIEGSLEDGGKSWGAGSYVRHAPGSVHRPSSRAGCTLFVSLPKPIELVGE